ncbi:MAG: carcinine hydrolase/isopenicillin-N N-acyltransferase family protein [Acidimicrobiia bacterium]
MCDTFVALTADGVLFGKNSDRDPNEAQVLEWHPAAEHPPGAEVEATWIRVPQVDRTHAVLISRPFWMWGAEMGANEHGVVIGNEAVFTKQPYADSGLTGMDLLRLALERSASAAEAVGVIVDLLETHGQGGGCGHEDRSFTYHNSFLVADRDGAIVLETAGGEWATEEVVGRGRSISNGLTIPGFADLHADRLRGAVAACETRRAITEAAAEEATGVLDVLGALRSHGATPFPRYRLANGSMGAPCVHAGGALAATQTTASWAADLAADRHWVTGTAAPCVSLYKPVRVGEPVDLGPAPTDRFDQDTVWWQGEMVHRRALKDPIGTFGRVWSAFESVQRHWVEDPPDSASAFDRARRETARLAGDLAGTEDERPRFVRRYWQERSRLAGFPPS